MNDKSFPLVVDGIEILYRGKKRHDFKNDIYTIELRNGTKYAQESICLPKIHKNGNYLHENNIYYPIPCLAKPLLVIDKNDRSVTIKNKLTDFVRSRNYDVKFELTKKETVMITYCGIVKFESLNYREMSRIIFTVEDRQYMNKMLNINSIEMHLGDEDIIAIENILDNIGKFQHTDWKELKNMRICTLPDMLSEVIVLTLPYIVYNFKKNGKIQNGYLERRCNEYMRESSQCQLDLEHTDIGKYALREKLALPIGSFSSAFEADPHTSWIGYIDSMCTPQSEKSGAVVALCDGIRIKGNKLIKEDIGIDDPRSGLMRKTVLFPQLLKAPRHVICSAIHKQCCNLGEEGEFNQRQTIRAFRSSHIPDIPGAQALVGLMDWNTYTHEDATVISKSFADRLNTYKIEHNKYKDSNGEMKVVIQEGDEIAPYQVAGMMSDDHALRLKNKIPGRITRISQYNRRVLLKDINCLDITTESNYKCMVGSKLSNLHSCKSIVSKILPDDRMPCMEDGTPLDMLISPISIGSRGAPSLLMEGMLGMWCRQTGSEMNIKAWDSDINFEVAASLLESDGLPSDCKFQLRNGSKGRNFDHKTFVGNLFVIRLHHHADDKLIWQDKNRFDHMGLGVKGIGNVRYGREELEILMQYGANGILTEAAKLSSNESTSVLIRDLEKMCGHEYIL